MESLVIMILALTQAFKKLFKQLKVSTEYLWVLATVLGAVLNAIPYYLSPWQMVLQALLQGAVLGFCASMGVSFLDSRLEKLKGDPLN